MDRVTTTRNFGMFRKEDITFKSPRLQSQILDELPSGQVESAEPDAPKSSTPEQVIRYYEECLSKTTDSDKRRIYALTIAWIRELEDRKNKEVAEKVKSFLHSSDEGADDSVTLDGVEAE